MYRPTPPVFDYQTSMKCAITDKPTDGHAVFKLSLKGLRSRGRTPGAYKNFNLLLLHPRCNSMISYVRCQCQEISRRRAYTADEEIYDCEIAGRAAFKKLVSVQTMITAPSLLWSWPIL